MNPLIANDIMNMIPSREFDALVAEKVIGVSQIDSMLGRYPGYVNRTVIKFYSTDISAAWEVVEELNGKYGFSLGRAGDYYEPDRKWNVRVGTNEWVEADTAPEAICKAALLAVMNDEQAKQGRTTNGPYL